jgi:lipopolysaccharide transport system ATP-binding protein
MTGRSGGETVIKVSGVSKRYLMFDRPEDRLKQMVVPRLQRILGRTARQYHREFAALSDVSFQVKRGETVGIIGRNGSGKSTMLQIICGTLQPSSGAVDVRGRVAALLELGAGFNPEFTGRENVYLNAAILGLSRGETDARFDAIARFADIGAFIDQPVKIYSSGMYVRLAFAVAINVDPDILVVDEALSVGDEAFQRKCFARIEQIRDNGGTILFVTHGTQTVVQLCDRAMLFDRGEMILEGSPKTVVTQYQRLANANEASQAVRESIKALTAGRSAGWTTNDSQHDRLIEPDSTDGAQPLDRRPNKSAGTTDDAPRELFDPGLMTKSRTDFEPNGARIIDLSLRNSRGLPVNVIVSGRDYTLTYEVSFDADIDDVGVGVGIRTTTGFSLGGANLDTMRVERLAHCHAGTRIGASFEFKCILLPGIYFFNLAVTGERDGAREYLARSTDALLFKVAAQEATTAGGLVDFGIRVVLRRSE